MLRLEDTSSLCIFSYVNIVYTGLIMLLSSSYFYCSSLTTLLDLRVSINYCFLIFVFPSFCTYLVPSADTRYPSGKQLAYCTWQPIIMLTVTNSHLLCDNQNTLLFAKYRKKLQQPILNNVVGLDKHWIFNIDLFISPPWSRPPACNFG